MALKSVEVVRPSVCWSRSRIAGIRVFHWSEDSCFRQERRECSMIRLRSSWVAVLLGAQIVLFARVAPAETVRTSTRESPPAVNGSGDASAKPGSSASAKVAEDTSGAFPEIAGCEDVLTFARWEELKNEDVDPAVVFSEWRAAAGTM